MVETNNNSSSNNNNNNNNNKYNNTNIYTNLSATPLSDQQFTLNRINEI